MGSGFQANWAEVRPGGFRVRTQKVGSGFRVGTKKVGYGEFGVPVGTQKMGSRSETKKWVPGSDQILFVPTPVLGYDLFK